MFIVVGPNVWARAESEEEALKKASKEAGVRRLKKYLVYESSDPNFKVTPFGNLEYAFGHDPRLVKRVDGRKVEVL
jgi:hypothetical protein